MSRRMTEKNQFIRPCPRCGKKVHVKEDPFRPFCSKECKQVDLGRWELEDYRIPAEYVEIDEAKHFYEEESE